MVFTRIVARKIRRYYICYRFCIDADYLCKSLLSMKYALQSLKITFRLLISSCEGRNAILTGPEYPRISIVDSDSCRLNKLQSVE